MTGNGRTEVRLAGAGGQGVVTAGRILAETAIRCGRNASQSQVYGPQSRGGASRSDVVIAEDAIGFPLTDRLDVLVVLSPEAYEKYVPDLDEGALLVVDADARPDGSAVSCSGHEFPIVDIAQRLVGSQVATGVVALGVLVGMTEMVDQDALMTTVASGVPPHRREANETALAEALDLGRAAAG